MKRAIRPGDYVRVTVPAESMKGRAGYVQQILRANRDYERRAVVQFSPDVSMTFALRFLEPAS